MSSSASARVCPSCAFANFGSHDRCLHCGAELPPAETELTGIVIRADEPAALARTCPVCGNAAGATDGFCTSCGSPLP